MRRLWTIYVLAATGSLYNCDTLMSALFSREEAAQLKTIRFKIASAPMP